MLYAALFLQLVVAYETCIESFVLGLAVRPGGVVSRHRNVHGRLAVKSYAHALAVAAGPGKEYADWINKEQLKKTALILVSKGRPFSSVADVDWQPIEKARYIRNAIAHPSQSAKEKFERNVIGNTPLAPSDRAVSRYLRGRLAQNPPQTRWELYAAQLLHFVNQYIR